MTNRTKLPLVALAGMALAVGGVWTFWPGSECRITLDNYHRIELTMSRDAVEGILGGPAGDYASRETDADDGPSAPQEEPIGRGVAWSPSAYIRGAKTCRWLGDTGIVAVDFDDEGRVEGARFYHAIRWERSPFSRVIAPFEWLWERIVP